LIHDHGLVSVLRDLHDDLDRAVSEAYGWSPELSTEDILFRLVELNAARAAEERSGLVRWLRPEFQQTTATQAGLGVEIEEEEQQPARASRVPWPPSLPERVRAVRDYLRQTPIPVSPETVARSFIRSRTSEVTAILETLTALGQANRDGAAYCAGNGEKRT
jgi:chromatin segregation and condensation protein Rec8/ScpA/Scc1 (kleisin family)